MSGTLEDGREACRRQAWRDAYRLLSLADQETPLDPEDLELTATSAYLIGRDLDFENLIDRAHHAHLEAGNPVRAGRCAFWMGLMLLLRGEMARASGWLARARRLVEDRDCAEQGYLLLPVAEQQLAAGEGHAAYAGAGDAADIGERFHDKDLVAFARHLQGRALIQQGQVQAGLGLLDETMLTVTAGGLSPIATGLVYCSVIEECRHVYAMSRAQEWTSALAGWCDRQPEMVAFSGTCLLLRAEIMWFHGAWHDALAEARRAADRLSRGGEREPPGAAFYQLAEMHRLRGEFGAAEEAYRRASRMGREPQPGFALLRMAQGRVDAACAMIRRLTSAVVDPLERAKLLPAKVEIMLVAGDIEDARRASDELEAIAQKYRSGVLDALAVHARGAVELAAGNAQAAFTSLRRAFDLWQEELEAPYEAARARVLIGQACLTHGDDEGCRLEMDAARAVFERLGAAPDLARLVSLVRRKTGARRHRLTPRELQILRLVTAGKTNRAIADQLFLSERTIDRHVSNIFTKLGVTSRAAATAYACQHDLL